MSDELQFSKYQNIDPILDTVSIYNFKRINARQFNDACCVNSVNIDRLNNICLNDINITTLSPKSDVINYLQLEELFRNSTTIFQEYKSLQGFLEHNNEVISQNILDNEMSCLIFRFGRELETFINSKRTIHNLCSRTMNIYSVMSKYNKWFSNYDSNHFNSKESLYNNLFNDNVKSYNFLSYSPDIYASRKRIYSYLVKKSIPKRTKQFANSRNITILNFKKIALLCAKEVRKFAQKSNRLSREFVLRSRRITRESTIYWRRFERFERETRRKAAKEASEKRKKEDEFRESLRQQRKLNFLITQTELYAHFVSRKMITSLQSENENVYCPKYFESNNTVISTQELILNRLDEPTNFLYPSDDNYNILNLKGKLLNTVENVIRKDNQHLKEFQEFFPLNSEINSQDIFKLNTHFNSPNMFVGILKAYQIKGMNWLANLYNQGINGILADEMGLGKTVQVLSLLAHLAEKEDIWGPFIIISPCTTLHNWQQECKRFVPNFNVLPYWGNAEDRRIIRKCLNKGHSIYNKESSFHILVTSYTLAVRDAIYLQKINWQYLILDEAQAIKSSSSQRWQALLNFKCRNRLLLTGTPIQNSMAELWALLHFIMPNLFDSHSEFNEWFSKDIESHIEGKTNSLNEEQLSRLHLILKPFMLRRVKKDVEHEMAPKIEINLECEMTSRQRILYKCLKDKISLEDLLNRSISIARFSGTTATSLLNIVMQFRKVCNHPELFERREVDSPLITHPLEIHIPRLLFNYYFQRNNFNDYTEIFYIHSSFNLFFNSDIQNLIFLLNLSVSEWRSLWTFNFLEKWSVLRIISLRLIIFSHWQTWKDKSFIPIHINLFFSPNINSDFDKFIFSGNDSSFLQFIKCTYPYFAAKFVLMCSESKVIANHSFLYASTFRAEVERQLFQSGGCAILKRFFTFGEMTYSSHKNPLKPLFYSSQGIMGIFIPDGWSRICIPAKNKLITDCGKMKLLDSLLFKLKNEGHRVLLYSQMTKMIDLLEEFVAFRRHKYIRFDGSTSIADRRDMVSDFQNNKHIFIFLLSTRAGGLGINLTAADTVIFYDSDWNPTVDQQAMDRAHRLGQMRQVTVYRLVTKGTIDERILERAREKNEIQHMVMEGGNFKIDIMKPKEIASLLIDTDQIDTHLVSNLQENLKQKLNTKDIKRKSKYNLISSKKTKIDTDSHITSLIVPDFHKNL